MIAPRDALAAIGQLPDAEIDIADAAIQLARIDAPDADWQAAKAALSDLARDAVGLARENAIETSVGRARALAQLLGVQYGFRGDTEAYDDPANANLIRVLQRQRGLPVALGILWLHASRAAGWPAHGIDFPAHFLLGVTGRGAALPIDVFAGGQTLDAAALHRLLMRFEGANAVLRPGLLRPMSTRAVLLRLQNNLLSRRSLADDVPGALACAEDMLRIAPDQADLWWQAAHMNRRLDRVAAALRCFEHYLALVPGGATAERARAAMTALRGRLN